MTKRFDAIILGAGQAGPSLANRLTQAGQSVAFVERHLFGGTCVNTGCMPTKTLVASARAAYVARNGATWGIGTGDVAIDMTRVKQRAADVSSNARNGVESWLRGMDKCTVFQAHATFESPTTVRAGDELLEGARIFVNVGCRARVPDMPGLATVPYLTNAPMLRLDVVPRHLVVIGGSYIGLEFAQMHRRFGAEVTVVERGARIVAREDDDVADAMKRALEEDGIRFHCGATDVSFAKDGTNVAVKVGTETLDASHVLVAVGRQPNTGDLGLEKAGIARDAHGYITVDDELRTNVPHVYALGDCNGRGAFTHTSYNDYEIVAANLLDGDSRRLSDRIESYALYIDPPLGRAGMTERAARATGRPLLVATRPMTRVGRAVEKGETRGFMKAIVDAETKLILGASIFGIEGDEAIHGIVDVMTARAPYTTLTRSVPIHPTVSELLPTLFGDLKPA